jgi:peptide deformylase
MKNIEEFLRKNYPIQTGINNPILRKKSEKIEVFDDELREFGHILFEWMKLYDWIGLAAPQIWVNKRIVVISQLDKKLKKVIDIKILVNPKIIEKSTKTQINEEGCLSLPGIEAEVERPLKIKVIYQDLDGKKHELNAVWFNAAIIQHEIDHLDGILFIDKAKQNKELNLSKLLKL